jgi:hypothetical protein
VTTSRQLRKIAAILTGGFLSGLFVVHLFHVAAVTAVPAYQFVCQIGH